MVLCWGEFVFPPKSLGDAFLAILEGLISFASDPTMVGSPMSLNLGLIFYGPPVFESLCFFLLSM